MTKKSKNKFLANVSTILLIPYTPLFVVIFIASSWYFNFPSWVTFVYLGLAVIVFVGRKLLK
tara:strand:+ start:3654 stop:3839 length:186 start_codon:yes stop_codon:yes gene_type:complete